MANKIITVFVGKLCCEAQFLVVPMHIFNRLPGIWYVGTGTEAGKENDKDAPQYDFYVQRSTGKCYARWLGEPIL